MLLYFRRAGIPFIVIELYYKFFKALAARNDPVPRKLLFAMPLYKKVKKFLFFTPRSRGFALTECLPAALQPMEIFPLLRYSGLVQNRVLLKG